MNTPSRKATQAIVQLGLRANWQQFMLLVIVNAFVGAMVGLERSIAPLLGHQVFGLESTTAVLSFIMSFGVVKALANLFAGRLGDRIGRKGMLVAGRLVGLPVPLLIIFAPAWGWVVFAKVLLGIGFALAGLVLSLFFVRESHGHARHEAALLARHAAQPAASAQLTTAISVARPHAPSFKDIFLLTSWKNRTLFGVSQAGSVNNLNDGLAWGVFPLFFAAGGLGTALVYPTLLAAVSDVAHPDWRASAVGVYRLWRDSGYAFGALAIGLVADTFGLLAGFWFAAAIMTVSGLMVALLMYETLPSRRVVHPAWEREPRFGVARPAVSQEPG